MTRRSRQWTGTALIVSLAIPLFGGVHSADILIPPPLLFHYFSFSCRCILLPFLCPSSVAQSISLRSLPLYRRGFHKLTLASPDVPDPSATTPIYLSFVVGSEEKGSSDPSAQSASINEWQQYGCLRDRQPARPSCGMTPCRCLLSIPQRALMGEGGQF